MAHYALSSQSGFAQVNVFRNGIAALGLPRFRGRVNDKIGLQAKSQSSADGIGADDPRADKADDGERIGIAAVNGEDPPRIAAEADEFESAGQTGGGNRAVAAALVGVVIYRSPLVSLRVHRLDGVTMNIMERIAEVKIREALERGDFNNLENAGKPLIFEDETWIPEDVRLTYRVLRNAGCVPPELELHRDIVTMKSLLGTIDDDAERIKKLRELNFKMLRFNVMRKRPLNLQDFPEYEEKVFARKLG